MTVSVPEARLEEVGIREVASEEDAADLLAEVYRNRRYELFATGLRWEDARRLGSVGVGGGIATRCWLPYTVGERNANPANVPADPEGSEPPAFPASCL